jgi:hypothetical protein
MPTSTDTANSLAAALWNVEALLPQLELAARNHANALKDGNEFAVGPLRKQLIIRGAQSITYEVLAYHDMLSRNYDPRATTFDGGGK